MTAVKPAQPFRLKLHQKIPMRDGVELSADIYLPHGEKRYPTNIRRWLNFTARGDTTALRPRLAPYFAEMLRLELVESIEDTVGFDNYFRGAAGLNVHDAYGYLSQPTVGEAVGSWLEKNAGL